jgi:hypothetical protein
MCHPESSKDLSALRHIHIKKKLRIEAFSAPPHYRRPESSRKSLNSCRLARAPQRFNAGALVRRSTRRRTAIPETLAAIMKTLKQFDVFELAKDINPNIKQGMRGVILDIWGVDAYEVEFVKEDGTNYEYKGQSTFTIDGSFIGQISK